MSGLSSSSLNQILQNDGGEHEGGCYEAFKEEVKMPACASTQGELSVLPVLQPNFYFPLLDNGSCCDHGLF